MNNFQRVGAISNAHVGRDFECRAQKVFLAMGVPLVKNFKVPCGLGNHKKQHTFDLGSDQPQVVVECKSQTWTAGGKIPVAKLHNWAVAMFYFHMAPPSFRKIFFVENSMRQGYTESLLAYFRRTHTHLIPHDVEFWELGRDSEGADIVICATDAGGAVISV